MTILIAAVLPLASTETQRDREKELIFRGRQYAEGIRVFRRRFGRYPTSLKEMLDTRPRAVRKLWKDPMTGTNDWGLVGLATPAPGILPGEGSGKGGPQPLPTPTKSPFDHGDKGDGTGLGGVPTVMGPILGVHSTSTKKGFRRYEGRDVYAEWRFTEQSLFPTFSGGETPGGQPGPGIGGGGVKGGGGSTGSPK
jgi:type II secretory pathway pseudopilin PulG